MGAVDSAGLLSGGAVAFGASLCFGACVGGTVSALSALSAGFRVSAAVSLSEVAVLSAFSFSAVVSVLNSVSAGRLLSVSVSGLDSVTVSVIRFSSLGALLRISSVAVLPQLARASIISPARRTAGIFRFVIIITSTYTIPKNTQKSSEICGFREKVTYFVPDSRPHRAIRPRIPPKPHGKRRGRLR